MHPEFLAPAHGARVILAPVATQTRTEARSRAANHFEATYEAARRERRGSAAAGQPQAIAFQSSRGRGLRRRAAAAAAARGRPTHSGARRAGGRAPTTGDAGAEIIRGPRGRALTAPRRARAAAAAARGRPTHTAPRGGQARALPHTEKRTPQYFEAARPHLLSTQVRSRR